MLCFSCVALQTEKFVLIFRLKNNVVVTRNKNVHKARAVSYLHAVEQRHVWCTSPPEFLAFIQKGIILAASGQASTR